MALLQGNLKKLRKPESSVKLNVAPIPERSKHWLNKYPLFLQLIGYFINQGKCFLRIFSEYK